MHRVRSRQCQCKVLGTPSWDWPGVGLQLRKQAVGNCLAALLLQPNVVLSIALEYLNGARCFVPEAESTWDHRLPLCTRRIPDLYVPGDKDAIARSRRNPLEAEGVGLRFCEGEVARLRCSHRCECAWAICGRQMNRRTVQPWGSHMDCRAVYALVCLAHFCQPHGVLRPTA